MIQQLMAAGPGEIPWPCDLAGDLMARIDLIKVSKTLKDRA